MQEVLAIALSAMQQDVARLERVSNNIANVATPGYKREMLVARPDLVGRPSFVQALAAGTATAAGDAAAGLAQTQPYDLVRDMTGGSLRTTSRALDVALVGPGFFEVVTPQGPAYTRQGEFQLDARGRLVTPQGHAVQGVGGEIVLGAGAVVIDANGNVTENGRLVDRLKVVSFDAPGNLKPLDGGLFAEGRNATLAPQADVQVRQGFLENSNVQHTREMVELIETMRRFESLQRVVQGYDDLVGTAVRRLGEG
jgi:flagellar basal-body rod protein FlgF